MTDPKTILEQPDAVARDAKVRRDQWGRYLLPHPQTGKEQAWTRVTTFASTVESTYALNKWEQRRLVWGLAQRPDLVAQAASCRVDDDMQLGGIIGDALQVAETSATANLGTAIHRFAERVDAGELQLSDIPLPNIRADVAAYVDTLKAAGIGIIPNWIERIVLIPELNVAGTVDRLVNGRWPLPRIGDIKTGQNIIRFGMTKIPLQFALYAHATHWYDPATDTMGEMLPVDQNIALAFHIPAGSGRCDIYEIDITRGWQAVQLAEAVRAWRTVPGGELAKLVTPMRGQPALRLVEEVANDPSWIKSHPEATLQPRIDWVRERVETIKEHGRLAELAELWADHPDVPTFKHGGPTTHEQVQIIACMCDEIEANSELPFPDPDPAQPKTTKANQAKAKAT